MRSSVSSSEVPHTHTRTHSNTRVISTFKWETQNSFHLGRRQSLTRRMRGTIVFMLFFVVFLLCVYLSCSIDFEDIRHARTDTHHVTQKTAQRNLCNNTCRSMLPPQHYSNSCSALDLVIAQTCFARARALYCHIEFKFVKVYSFCVWW